jgi:hypothetical protein
MSTPLASSLKANDTDTWQLPTVAELRQPEQVINAIHSIRKKLLDLSSGYRAALRAELGRICFIAEFLASDSRAWSAFCRCKLWKRRSVRPTKGDRGDALRFVLHATLGGTSTADSKRVSKYHAALSVLVADGVEPAEVPTQVVKRGGVEKLARAGAQSRASRRGASISKPKPKSAPKVVADFTNTANKLAKMELPGLVHLTARIDRTNAGHIRVSIEDAFWIEHCDGPGR